MKNIIRLIVMAGVLITGTSCDDFLSKYPHNTQNIENSYETPGDIKMAVNGCYNALINIKRCSEHLFNENLSDNANYPNTDNIASNYDAFTPSILMTSVSNSYIAPYWRHSYTLISRVNLVLEYLDVVTDENHRKQYEAEVKFLRAWSYFNLVRYFGGVPLVTHTISSEEARRMARASVDEVYTCIEQDLQDAYRLLDEIQDRYKPVHGNVNRWAAKGLLAKVYLTRGNKTAAQPLLQDVYDNSGYKLTANYEDLFVSSLEDSKGKEEILFPVRFEGGSLGIGNTFSTLLGHVNLSVFGSNLSYWSEDLRDQFVNTSDTAVDRRFPVTCGLIPGTVMVGVNELKRLPPKCVGLTAGTYEIEALVRQNDGPLDWPELRFADIILMLAEVKGKEGGGLNLINELRTRAQAPALTEEIIRTEFNGSFQDAVLNERRLELAFENQRYFDMLRMGDEYATRVLLNFFNTQSPFSERYQSAYALVKQVIAGGKIDSWRLLLPIPLDEILKSNALEQNPGYSNNTEEL